jgi:2-haloalkanoic acid dehalogenase type II
MRLSAFKVMSFDCYGTLIDWESGIVAALGPWRKRTGVATEPEALLAAFATSEAAVQADRPDMPYPQVLARVFERMSDRLGALATAAETRAFAASIGEWPAFADSAPALRTLRGHVALVVLSNIDRASFALSNARLRVVFDAVYTAQDIGAYKPDPRSFEYMLARLSERGLDKGEVLHVAQSLYHDHAPAKALGLATAWIDRRAGKADGGATRAPERPVDHDFRFESLAALAAAHRAELALSTKNGRVIGSPPGQAKMQRAR